MAKTKSGALVLYCGHRACFIADIMRVGTANVVRANGPVFEPDIPQEFEWGSCAHDYSLEEAA